MAKNIKIEVRIIGRGRFYFLFFNEAKINYQISHKEISENETVEPNNLL